MENGGAAARIDFDLSFIQEAQTSGLTEMLDLTGVTVVGHSTGGGEVARYIGRHGTKQIAKAVLIAAVPPIMLKSGANPEGFSSAPFGIRTE